MFRPVILDLTPSLFYANRPINNSEDKAEEAEDKVIDARVRSTNRFVIGIGSPFRGLFSLVVALLWSRVKPSLRLGEVVLQLDDRFGQGR